MLDRSGATIGRLSFVRRVNVPLDRVPRQLRAAFIAVEDRRFYYHRGVDWRSAARALVRNATRGDVSEGFSTITMQVVRNVFVPRLAHERSLRRKLIEVYLAGRLEHSLTKQQILALYLNVIYLGNGAYGVEAASRDLFGKSVNRLTVAEAATLAAVARGPSFYAPRRHPARALARRNLVLGVMAREHYLSDSAAARARAEPLRLSPTEWRPREDRSFALDPVRAAVDSLVGDKQLGDLIVYTTLDGRAQRAAETAVRRQADAIQRVPGRDTLQGALRGDRSAKRGDPRGGGRPAVRAGRVQSRVGRAAAAGVRVQTLRLRCGARPGPDAVGGDRGRSGRHQRARASLAPGQLRRPVTPAPSRSGARSCAPPTPRPSAWARRWANGTSPRSPAGPGSGARSPRCPRSRWGRPR